MASHSVMCPETQSTLLQHTFSITHSSNVAVTLEFFVSAILKPLSQLSHALVRWIFSCRLNLEKGFAHSRCTGKSEPTHLNVLSFYIG